MKKYAPLITVMITLFVSVGLMTNSAIAAEELPVKETIELPSSQALFGEKPPTSPFSKLIVGPEKNFFVIPSTSDSPVVKFTKTGKPKKIKAIEEGKKIREEYQKNSELSNDPSEIDFSSIKLNDSPEKAMPSSAKDITLYPHENIIFGGGSALYEITPDEEFVARHFAIDSYNWKDRIRIIDVAVDADGNMYVATMDDEIRKVGSDKGLVKTWSVDRKSFDADIPDYSYPRLVTTSEHLFALMGQTDKLLKYDLSGNLVDSIDLPDKEFGNSTKERTLEYIDATQNGNLVAYEKGTSGNWFHVLNSNGKIERSYKVPQSVSEVGKTYLADIAIGPEGGIYTISTTRNPFSSSDSEHKNFITSADIGLESQLKKVSNKNSNSDSKENNAQNKQANNKNEKKGGYWKLGATSSLNNQSSQDVSVLKKLVNSLMQLKVLIGME